MAKQAAEAAEQGVENFERMVKKPAAQKSTATKKSTAAKKTTRSRR
jgi:hypothetical protein